MTFADLELHPLSKAFHLRVAFAWGLVSGLLLVVNWNAIANLQFPDPDDIMRLVQVRDLVAGQSWFDVSQLRADAPSGGVPMHWSRLVDLPLALMIVALTPLFGSAQAELLALIIVPLVTFGLAMSLAARIAWQLVGREEAVLTCLVMALSIPLVFQMGPLRIDHHGWQIVCALAAVNGLLSPSARRGGWLLGLALSVWLAISIEGLPLAAAFCAITAFRWLRNPARRAWLVHTIQALATGSVGLFLVTRGIGDLATYCDAIGPVHLAMFVWGAAVLTALGSRGPMPLLLTLGGFALAAGGALAILFAAAPQCAGGGFAELDPVVQQYWHVRVSEGMPVWQQSPAEILKFAIAPVIGIFATLHLAARSRGAARSWWYEYAGLLIAAVAISLLVARAGAVAGALAAVPLAWQIRRWLRMIRVMPNLAPRALATLGVMIAVLPAFPLMVLSWTLPAQAASTGATMGPPAPKASACRISETSKLLRTLPTGEVFALLDIAPQVLLNTDHAVIATGHHRGHIGMRFVIETALGSSAEAEAALRDRGSDYVALCTDLAEPQIYAHYGAGGFVDDLVTGRALSWLEPVALETEGTLRVWRITPE